MIFHEGKVAEMDSRQTVLILEKLVRLGFDDDAFWRLHHFREPTEKRPNSVHETIEKHLKYCAAGKVFESGGENERVYKRLKFVWKVYTDVGFPAQEKIAFVALAEAAFHAIPTHRRSVG